LADRAQNEVVNIGSGIEYSIRWYAGEICKMAGYDPEKIIYDTSRYVGVRSKRLSISMLETLLPDFTATPIEDALQATVECYQQEAEVCR
jgi:GDP-L-fucose synthase